MDVDIIKKYCFYDSGRDLYIDKKTGAVFVQNDSLRPRDYKNISYIGIEKEAKEKFRDWEIQLLKDKE